MGAIWSFLLSAANRRGTEDWTPEVPCDEFTHLQPVSHPDSNPLQAWLVGQASGCLGALNSYSSCAEVTRRAISTPSPATEAEAYKKLSPAVQSIAYFYNTALKMEDPLSRLLMFYCSTNGGQSTQARVESLPYGVSLLADTLLFVQTFDEIKMANPSLQNDFSFYRRSLNRIRAAQQMDPSLTVLQEELTNRISFFIAQATPMTKMTIDTLVKLIHGNQIQVNGLTDIFSIIVAVCFTALGKKNDSGEPQKKMRDYAKIMVMACVLYDQVDPEGVFIRTSKIPMKAVIQRIKKGPVPDSGPLLNSLRYMTLHLGDDSTPKAIKNLLEDES